MSQSDDGLKLLSRLIEQRRTGAGFKDNVLPKFESNLLQERIDKTRDAGAVSQPPPLPSPTQPNPNHAHPLASISTPRKQAARSSASSVLSGARENYPATIAPLPARHHLIGVVEGEQREDFRSFIGHTNQRTLYTEIGCRTERLRRILYAYDLEALAELLGMISPVVVVLFRTSVGFQLSLLSRK